MVRRYSWVHSPKVTRARLDPVAPPHVGLHLRAPSPSQRLGVEGAGVLAPERLPAPGFPPSAGLPP